ncbi:hypothetical protein [Streptomyces sp. YIM 98790]|uniref:hypothetical protein n=1 Tax=Streptomyces sp. YIM 98790 TaxID=2689077 RepID=UPI00140B429F|nr:hypothetical protein [Streptomyces sp. YIM 98790]
MRAPVRPNPTAVIALLLAAAAGVTACGGGETGVSAQDTPGTPRQTSPTAGPTFDPEDFTTTIDNPYLPLEPGTRFTYRSAEGEGGTEAVVEVTDETTDILGVTVRIVAETVSVDGVVVEESRNWFAQDGEGNVWTFGADLNVVEDTEIAPTPGALAAGRDGAHPGIAMPADPQPGTVYPTRDTALYAETVEVVSVDESVEVPHGSFRDVVVTEETDPLNPEAVHHRHYAEGLGLVLREQVEGGGDRLRLTAVDRP